MESRETEDINYWLVVNEIRVRTLVEYIVYRLAAGHKLPQLATGAVQYALNHQFPEDACEEYPY